MGESPESIAQKFIKKYFPNCKVALLAGSAYRQELTKESDLDLVLLDETEQTSYRECFFCFGWKIEAFVFNTLDSLEFAFEFGYMEGLPTIQRMCSESIILKDDGTAMQLQKEAAESMAGGPHEWTKNEQDHARFMITDLLNDLNASNDKQEQLFIVNKLFEVVNEFVLRANDQWIGYGKWMFRSLSNYNQVWSTEWINCYEEYIVSRNIEPLNKCVEQLLRPYGGRDLNCPR